MTLILRRRTNESWIERMRLIVNRIVESFYNFCQGNSKDVSIEDKPQEPETIDGVVWSVQPKKKKTTETRRNSPLRRDKTMIWRFLLF